MPKLIILNPNKTLDPFIEILETSFSLSLDKVRVITSLLEFEVTVSDKKEYTMPETGITGYTPSAKEMYIYIDPTSHHFMSHAKNEFCSTLVHELHHILRWNTIGYGETLFEALVSEGLADHFDMEINQTKPQPWSTALTQEQLQEAKEHARLEFDATSYDHNKWFFGNEEIPRWTGYALGFDIVKTYINKTGRKASELISTPAAAFLLEENIPR